MGVGGQSALPVWNCLFVLACAVFKILLFCFIFLSLPLILAHAYNSWFAFFFQASYFYCSLQYMFLGYLNCCFTFYIYRYAYLWWETHDWSLAAGKFFLLFNVNNTSFFFLCYWTSIRVMLTSALVTGLAKESNILGLLWKLCIEFLNSLKSVVFNLKLAPLRHQLTFSLVLVCFPRECVQHFTWLTGIFRWLIHHFVIVTAYGRYILMANNCFLMSRN